MENSRDWTSVCKFTAAFHFYFPLVQVVSGLISMGVNCRTGNNENGKQGNKFRYE